MVDLLASIDDIVKSYINIQGEFAVKLVQNNSGISYNELMSMASGIIYDSQINPNYDLRKLWAACYINAILLLPIIPKNSKGLSFTLELTSQTLQNLIYLNSRHNLKYQNANDRLISRISEAIINSKSIEEFIKWAKQAKAINEWFETDISYINSLISLKTKIIFSKNHRKENKILKNLENLLELKKLQISIGKAQNILINYALELIEGVIDSRILKDKEIVPSTGLNTCKRMLNIINQLDKEEKKYLKVIRKLNQKMLDNNLQIQDNNEYFLDYVWQIQVQDENEMAIEYENSEIIIGKPIFVNKDVSVYQCNFTWNGKEIDAAIKTYTNANPIKHREKFEKEVKILQSTMGRGRYFLDYYRCFIDEKIENQRKKYRYNILMEYCPKNLNDEIKKRKRKGLQFSPKMLSTICLDLLEAFESLLRLKIYHRDIKPDNIFIAKNRQLKIADFNVSGFSRESEKSYNPTQEYDVVGTVSYMAPELKKAWLSGKSKENYRPEKSDVFSLGLIFYQCATLKDISTFNDNTENREKILQDVDLSWLKDIIYDMLTFDFNARPSFRKILSQMMQKSTETIINQLTINEENIKDLNESLSAHNESVSKFPNQSIIITKRSQLIMGVPIFVKNEASFYLCRIKWKGKEIDAVIKTYKDLNGYKIERKHEAEILKLLSEESQFFLNFYGYFCDEIIEDSTIKYCSNIVMEYCPYNLLTLMESRISKKMPFYQQDLNKIVLDLLKGSRILSSHKIYHRNIKPDNILVTEEGQLKIYDFNVQQAYIMASSDYEAPELRNSLKQGINIFEYKPERADVFSLGLLFYQLATFSSIARFNEDPQNREEILTTVQLPWLRELLYDMLCFDYKDRLTFKKALKRVMHEKIIAMSNLLF